MHRKLDTNKSILITGGAGYIGSHTLIELAKANFNFVVCDNLSNSSKEAINRVSKIINTDIVFISCDIRNSEGLRKIFEDYTIDSVIHFAGLKAIGESVMNPLSYYDNKDNGNIQITKVANVY